MKGKVDNPTRPVDGPGRGRETHSGNRALSQEEPLIFELSQPHQCGVDLPQASIDTFYLDGLERTDPIGLPGLSEPQAVRHYVRLSQKNYSIDTGLYPLGSCTMKHNPRLNEKVARLPGFADIHPLQPVQSVQGALELMDAIEHWLIKLTGMSAVALSPRAGAHGELLGLMVIRSALEARGNARKKVLVSNSAHGTNPATAAQCGYGVETVAAGADGKITAAAVAEKLDDDVAAIMLTNPNTCGLFEREIVEIAAAVHKAGAFFYCDGANFNAIVGKVRPGDLGIDAMHINLHKTFSTPHGGGGPGSGPVVLSEELARFAPYPYLVKGRQGFELVEADGQEKTHESLGRLAAFHGQMGMYIRALAYMLSHGSDGLRQVAEDAVLSANYIMASLSDVMSLPYDGPCMHEVLFDDKFLADTGVTTLDLAKAMIDEGYHPMTIYFPLVVHGAMLIEPTETESKQELDRFISVMRHLVLDVKERRTEKFSKAPRLAPRRRLDETTAARKPILRWRAPTPAAQAAE